MIFKQNKYWFHILFNPKINTKKHAPYGACAVSKQTLLDEIPRSRQIPLCTPNFRLQFLDLLRNKLPFQLQILKDLFTSQNCVIKSKAIRLNSDRIRSDSVAWVPPSTILLEDIDLTVGDVIHDSDMSIFPFRSDDNVSLHKVSHPFQNFPTLCKKWIARHLLSIAEPSDLAHSKDLVSVKFDEVYALECVSSIVVYSLAEPVVAEVSIRSVHQLNIKG